MEIRFTDQYCPKCKKMFTPLMIALDGGSKVCPDCGTHCHTCYDGTISKESPIHCKLCKKAKDSSKWKCVTHNV